MAIKRACVAAQIRDKWKLHKPLVATYWFVQLDTSKQAKVMEVVRSKVREVAVKTWKRPNIEQISLYRAFNRVFNRLLANHGQALWDCLVDNSSWETMLVKSTERLSDVELGCCRRLVQLCCDCLLTVYCCATNATSLQRPPRSNQLPWMKANPSSSFSSRIPPTLIAPSSG